MVQLPLSQESSREDALIVERKLRRLFKALDAEGTGLVPRDAALRLIRAVLGAEDLDIEALHKLCPLQMCSDELRYDEFRELTQVAGAWVVLGDVDRTHFERRWTSITDPENNYTIDFPLRRITSSPPGAGDPLMDEENIQEDPEGSKAMFTDRIQRLRMVEPEIRTQICKRILANIDNAAPMTDQLAQHMLRGHSGLRFGASRGRPTRPRFSDDFVDFPDPDIDSSSSESEKTSGDGEHHQNLATLPNTKKDAVDSTVSSQEQSELLISRESSETNQVLSNPSFTSSQKASSSPHSSSSTTTASSINSTNTAGAVSRLNEPPVSTFNSKLTSPEDSAPCASSNDTCKTHSAESSSQSPVTGAMGGASEKMNAPVPNNSMLDIVKSLTSGAIAGATAKTVIAPLDRTKIIFQTTDRKFSVRAAAMEMRRIVVEEGVRGLWRGHSATLSRVAPYAALQFVSFDFYKGMMLRDGDSHLTPLRRLMAGSMAGATSVCATYPLDLLRARMAVQSRAQGGMRHNFRVILQSEGVSGMYRGLGPTLFGIVPYAGLAFGTFETLKMMVSQHYGSETVTAGQRLGCGALAGFVAQSLTYPLDIVRRRMQTDGMHALLETGKPGQRKYSSILQTLTHVARHEGVVGGLFKGLSMNWVKGPISHGISFTTFDLMKRYLDVQPARK